MKNSPLLLTSVAVVALMISAGLFGSQTLRAQTISGIDRARAHTMLKMMKDDIQKNYYDPGFHGVDLESNFKKANDKIDKATSIGQTLRVIAQFMVDLDDSHTFFFPPSRASRTDYGWRYQMVGDKCMLTGVKPGSDAEAKGLKPGDVILDIDGYTPSRENLWKIQYLYNALEPRTGARMVVVSPDGVQRQVDVMSHVQQGKKLMDLTTASVDYYDLVREGEKEDRITAHRYFEMENAFIWKMPQFDMARDKVDDMMNKVRKSKALILDLRENGGGYEETLLRLLGNLFDHDVTLGEIKRRKETKPLVAKTRGGDGVFKGQVIVLIDSNSGSASELFARTIQLEKRGTVIGDTSAGAVMRARSYSHESGVDTVVFYGASITDADITMSDGKGLEKVGVTPDKKMLPTGADLQARRDPVLAYAASLADIKVTPEKAGAMFPMKWK
jgi:carboxyl-terminal processing protease